MTTVVSQGVPAVIFPGTRVARGAAPVALVQWGPDFGGVNGDRLNQGQGIAIAEIEFGSGVDQSQAVALVEAALEAGLSQAQAFALVELAISADLSHGQALALVELALTADLAQAQSIAFTQFDAASALAHAQDVALVQLEVLSGMSQAHALGDPRYSVSARLAAKDSWVDDIVGCASDLNRNGTDLSIDGATATKKDIYFSFDLLAYPAVSTVLSATLTFRVKTAPVGLSLIATLGKVTDNGEAWDEATIKCSNKPAIASLGQDVTIATGTGGTDIVVALGAPARDRLGERMGQASCTLAMFTSSLVGAVLEATDEGTNDAFGPRLEIEFSAP